MRRRRIVRAVAVGIAVALIAVVPSRAEDTSDAPVIVHLADGSGVPLVGWSFSYEYDLLRENAASTFGSTLRRDIRDLFAGKALQQTAGATLEVQYREYDQAEEVDGQTQTTKVAVAKGFVLTSAGKKNELHLEPPPKEVLVPEGVKKGMVARARGLDFVGTTLTGTKRSFCLVSYVAEVQCHPPASVRVLRIEFPK